MTFWIIVIGATALTAAIIARPLFRRNDAAAPRAAHDAQVFRDQLKELDRDLERGTVDVDQAEATKLEISRRLLAADAEETVAAGARPAPRAASLVAAAALIVAAPIGAAILYNDLGAPGAQDQPFASRGDENRPDQMTAQAMLAGEQFEPPAGPDADDFRKLVTQLEQRLENNPNDPQGVFLLGRSLMQLGRFDEAWPRFEQAIELNPQISLEARAGLAEGMILATGGYISPEAEAALLELVKRDPTNESGRYYLGRLHVQANDLEYARAIWGRLLADSPAEAPWVAPIRRELAQIGGGAQVASAAPTGRGPTEDEIAAAAELPEDERIDMVRTMVNGLAERLSVEGGTIGEYVQLIRSWQVLREFGQAEAVRAEAREIFAGNDDALAQLAAIPPSPSGSGDGLEALQAAPADIFEPEQPASSPAPGPDADDIAAAAEMEPDDRQAMIRGMVQRLDDRLTENGGSADEWLRLISSYSVLGDQAKAADAAARAQASLANRPGELSVLNAALNGGAQTEAPAPAPAPSSPGPTQEDIAAAAEMDPDDRQAMVRGMVARLHDRLTTDGRVVDVNEWGKLMRAYNVLGDTDAIRAAYEEAVEIYADDSISKAYLKEAALLNGVTFE